MLAHWYGLLLLANGGIGPPDPPLVTQASNEVELRRPQRRQIVVAHNGKDYVVELEDLPDFLNQIQETVRETVVERAAVKRTKKTAPVVKIVDAPEDTKALVLNQLNAVNRLIRDEWAMAVADYFAYKAAVDQDEEEIELLLMAV